MEQCDILSKLYETIVSLPPTASYRKKGKEMSREWDKFLDEIGKEKQEKLEYLTDLIYEMDEELSKQAFYEGFIMAFNLCTEINYIQKERDNY